MIVKRRGEFKHKLLCTCISSWIFLGVFGALAVCIPAFAQVSGSPLGAISALAYSPDGKRVAVGLYGQVVLYDTANWQPVGTFTQVEDTVRSLAFSPDSKTLAVGSGFAARDGDLLLWDTTGATPLKILPPQKDTIEAIAYRPDGKALLIGSNDNKAHFFHLPLGYGPTLDEHNGRVLAVAFSSKPDFVYITGAMDKVVKVWDAQRNQVVINFDQSGGGVTGLAFLPNGVQLVGASLDGHLRWWQVNYNERKREFSGSYYRDIGAHEGGVLAMSLSANGQRLVTGGEDNRVRVWKADDGGKVRVFKDALKPIYAVALSPDGKVAVGGGQEGVLRAWDVEANKLLTTLTPPPLPKATPAKSKKVVR